MLAGTVVLIIVFIIGIIWLIPAYTKPFKDREGNILKGSIALLEKVSLGEKDQWILLRGVDVSKPVLLFLHGGPGTADMTFLRKPMQELEKHFVLVSWDQRGAGKSYAAIDPESSMTISQILSDANELTRLLCKRFKQEKIFLAGHSWGSVLGVLSVRNYPHLYHAYVGIGQISNMQENERLSYEWTLDEAQKANDLQAVKKLIQMGKPPYRGDWQKKFMDQRRLLGKYRGEFYSSSMGAFPVVVGSLIRSTEYSWTDKVNFFRGIFRSVRLIWPELMTINLVEMAPRLKVPVYFALGKHDHEAPFRLAKNYFDILEAPHKELIWFENSAHMPQLEENEKFTNLLINHVLPAINRHEPVMFKNPMGLN